MPTRFTLGERFGRQDDGWVQIAGFIQEKRKSRIAYGEKSLPSGLYYPNSPELESSDYRTGDPAAQRRKPPTLEEYPLELGSDIMFRDPKLFLSTTWRVNTAPAISHQNPINLCSRSTGGISLTPPVPLERPNISNYVHGCESEMATVALFAGSFDATHTGVVIKLDAYFYRFITRKVSAGHALAANSLQQHFPSFHKGETLFLGLSYSDEPKEDWYDMEILENAPEYSYFTTGSSGSSYSLPPGAISTRPNPRCHYTLVLPLPGQRSFFISARSEIPFRATFLSLVDVRMDYGIQGLCAGRHISMTTVPSVRMASYMDDFPFLHACGDWVFKEEPMTLDDPRKHVRVIPLRLFSRLANQTSVHSSSAHQLCTHFARHHMHPKGMSSLISSLRREVLQVTQDKDNDRCALAAGRLVINLLRMNELVGRYGGTVGSFLGIVRSYDEKSLGDFPDLRAVFGKDNKVFDEIKDWHFSEYISQIISNASDCLAEDLRPNSQLSAVPVTGKGQPLNGSFPRFFQFQKVSDELHVDLDLNEEVLFSLKIDGTNVCLTGPVTSPILGSKRNDRVFYCNAVHNSSKAQTAFQHLSKVISRMLKESLDTSYLAMTSFEVVTPVVLGATLYFESSSSKDCFPYGFRPSETAVEIGTQAGLSFDHPLTRSKPFCGPFAARSQLGSLISDVCEGLCGPEGAVAKVTINSKPVYIKIRCPAHGVLTTLGGMSTNVKLPFRKSVDRQAQRVSISSLSTLSRENIEDLFAGYAEAVKDYALLEALGDADSSYKASVNRRHGSCREIRYEATGSQDMLMLVGPVRDVIHYLDIPKKKLDPDAIIGGRVSYLMVSLDGRRSGTPLAILSLDRATYSGPARVDISHHSKHHVEGVIGGFAGLGLQDSKLGVRTICGEFVSPDYALKILVKSFKDKVAEDVVKEYVSRACDESGVIPPLDMSEAEAAEFSGLLTQGTEGGLFEDSPTVDSAVAFSSIIMDGSPLPHSEALSRILDRCLFSTAASVNELSFLKGYIASAAFVPFFIAPISVLELKKGLKACAARVALSKLSLPIYLTFDPEVPTHMEKPKPDALKKEHSAIRECVQFLSKYVKTPGEASLWRGYRALRLSLSATPSPFDKAQCIFSSSDDIPRLDFWWAGPNNQNRNMTMQALALRVSYCQQSKRAKSFSSLCLDFQQGLPHSADVLGSAYNYDSFPHPCLEIFYDLKSTSRSLLCFEKHWDEQTAKMPSKGPLPFLNNGVAPEGVPYHGAIGFFCAMTSKTVPSFEDSASFLAKHGDDQFPFFGENSTATTLREVCAAVSKSTEISQEYRSLEEAVRSLPEPVKRFVGKARKEATSVYDFPPPRLGSSNQDALCLAHEHLLQNVDLPGNDQSSVYDIIEPPCLGNYVSHGARRNPCLSFMKGRSRLVSAFSHVLTFSEFVKFGFERFLRENYPDVHSSAVSEPFDLRLQHSAPSVNPDDFLRSIVISGTLIRAMEIYLGSDETEDDIPIYRFWRMEKGLEAALVSVTLPPATVEMSPNATPAVVKGSKGVVAHPSLLTRICMFFFLFPGEVPQFDAPCHVSMENSASPSTSSAPGVYSMGDGYLNWKSFYLDLCVRNLRKRRWTSPRANSFYILVDLHDSWGVERVHCQIAFGSLEEVIESYFLYDSSSLQVEMRSAEYRLLTSQGGDVDTLNDSDHMNKLQVREGQIISVKALIDFCFYCLNGKFSHYITAVLSWLREGVRPNEQVLSRLQVFASSNKTARKKVASISWRPSSVNPMFGPSGANLACPPTSRDSTHLSLSFGLARHRNCRIVGSKKVVVGDFLECDCPDFLWNQPDSSFCKYLESSGSNGVRGASFRRAREQNQLMAAPAQILMDGGLTMRSHTGLYAQPGETLVTSCGLRADAVLAAVSKFSHLKRGNWSSFTFMCCTNLVEVPERCEYALVVHGFSKSSKYLQATPTGSSNDISVLSQWATNFYKGLKQWRKPPRRLVMSPPTGFRSEKDEPKLRELFITEVFLYIYAICLTTSQSLPWLPVFGSKGPGKKSILSSLSADEHADLRGHLLDALYDDRNARSHLQAVFCCMGDPAGSFASAVRKGGLPPTTFVALVQRIWLATTSALKGSCVSLGSPFTIPGADALVMLLEGKVKDPQYQVISLPTEHVVGTYVSGVQVDYPKTWLPWSTSKGLTVYVKDLPVNLFGCHIADAYNDFPICLGQSYRIHDRDGGSQGEVLSPSEPDHSLAPATLRNLFFWYKPRSDQLSMFRELSNGFPSWNAHKRSCCFLPFLLPRVENLPRAFELMRVPLPHSGASLAEKFQARLGTFLHHSTVMTPAGPSPVPTAFGNLITKPSPPDHMISPDFVEQSDHSISTDRTLIQPVSNVLVMVICGSQSGDTRGFVASITNPTVISVPAGFTPFSCCMISSENPIVLVPHRSSTVRTGVE